MRGSQPSISAMTSQNVPPRSIETLMSAAMMLRRDWQFLVVLILRGILAVSQDLGIQENVFSECS